MWVALFVWFFIKISRISLLDTMLLYTLGYTGACALYSFSPDRMMAFIKKEKSLSQAFGSGITVTGHLIIQSVILIIISAYCG